MGTLQSELTKALLELEMSSLVRLSRAAREARQPQIALNSVVSAMRSTPKPGLEVRTEFANVLWLQKEQKLAIECLREGLSMSNDTERVQKALTLAKLVNGILF